MRPYLLGYLRVIEDVSTKSVTCATHNDAVTRLPGVLSASNRHALNQNRACGLAATT